MLTSLNNTTRRNRKRKIVAPPPVGTPIYILSTDAAGAVLTIELDQPVILNGLPAFTVGSAHVISASQEADTEISLTFSGGVGGGAPLMIPFQDPAIRNASGGYVTGNQVPVG